MRFLFYLLIALGIQGLVQPLTYTFCERQYRKNPEAEKEYSFELLDVVFRHKYAKAIFIAAGIICFIAAIIVFKIYISPAL